MKLWNSQRGNKTKGFKDGMKTADDILGKNIETERGAFLRVFL